MAKKHEAEPPLESAFPVPDVDWDALSVEVYERRLLGLLDAGSEAIALNVPGDWHLRWVNSDLAGRWAHVVHTLKYVPVKTSELADPRAMAGFVATPEGYVARGDRGREVLVRMPRAWFEKIKRAEAEARTRRTQDGQKLRDELSQAVAGRYGDEAAETVAGWKGTVQAGLERVE